MDDNLKPITPLLHPDTYLGRLIGRAIGVYASDCAGEPDPGTLGGLAVTSAREDEARARRRLKMERRARRAGFFGPAWRPDVDEGALGAGGDV